MSLLFLLLLLLPLLLLSLIALIPLAFVTDDTADAVEWHELPTLFIAVPSLDCGSDSVCCNDTDTDADPDANTMDASILSPSSFNNESKKS